MKNITVFESQIRKCIKNFVSRIKTTSKEIVSISEVNVEVGNGYIFLSVDTDGHSYYQELEKFDYEGWVNMNFFMDDMCLS